MAAHTGRPDPFVDPFVVDTAPLSEIVNVFIREWERDRPPRATRVGRSSDGLRPMGAVTWIAQESGLSRETVRRVVEGRSATTELRIAEPIVHGALAKPYLFYDGTLEVKVNERATPADRERARESLNGSGATD